MYCIPGNLLQADVCPSLLVTNVEAESETERLPAADLDPRAVCTDLHPFLSLHHQWGTVDVCLED